MWHKAVVLVATAFAVLLACFLSNPCLAAKRDPDLEERKPTKAEIAAREKERKAREKRRQKREQEEARERARRPKNGKVIRDKDNPLELDVNQAGGKKVTAKTFAPFRTQPCYKGEFEVDMFVVTFPDCEAPTSVKQVVEDLTSIGEYTIKDYYLEYSQGITWPHLYDGYGAVYMAPHPIGYYCRYDSRSNKLGFKDPSDGGMRVSDLKRKAHSYILKNSSTGGHKPAPIATFVFCNRIDMDRVKDNVEIRDEYPKPDEEWDFDPIVRYKPRIPWADPLWPHSGVQTLYPGNGGVMVHELGHRLGSPDYYHSSEEHDGMPGGPDLHSYGPTGPGYNRYIYHAFAPKECFPTLEKDGTYSLDPRSSPINRESGAPKPVLGCFIPSAHPHYVFQLEYAHNDKRPVGHVDEGGLLVNVINVDTALDHMKGPPDLCYTYRRGDPYLKGLVSTDAFLREGDEFNLESDPAAILPPLIPGGIEISGIEFKDGKCFFDLHFVETRTDAKFLKDSLLPIVKLERVEEVLPTSFRAYCDVLYRGEPLLDEYGFTWDTKPEPDVKKNRFPLYHRDRYDARILGLKPGTKYYVRAYVKNANGITYSKDTITVTTPKTVSEVPPLLTDRFTGNGYITQDFDSIDADMYCASANAPIALMSLGCYYGTMPGRKLKDEKPLVVRDVHTNPSDSRPKFRMESFGKCLERAERVATEGGLMDRKFEKFGKWRGRCAKALGIKEAAKAFVHTDTVEALDAERPKVKEWLDESKPVLLIRENKLMPGITSHIFPLDIAIIDGYDEDGKWHIYFPLGVDRGMDDRPNGYYSSDELLTSAVDAYMLYWAPSVSTSAKNKK